MVKKSGSESATRKHKFISFRDKIDSIKIDPIRRVRRKVTDYSDQTSFFLTAFEHWSELNLSADFTDFAQECSPYVGSLPLIFHHQKEIAEVLFKHISNNDINSLESLLDLISHFAHDLGPDFHPYFGKTLDLLVSMTSSMKVEVLEWSFNCLAYLFKFLSRLLTTDLRPTYDTIAPLLGKSHQRDYVNRFAAESLAFLLRKCTGDGLNLIVEHIVADVHVHSSDEFLNSIITLFAESMKSSGTTLHSRSSAILASIISISYSQKIVVYSGRLVGGVLAELLHHTQKDDAGVLYETVLAFSKKSLELSLEEDQIQFYLMLVINLVALRKGSRVWNWNEMYEISISLFEKLEKYENSQNILILVNSLAVALLCYSDFASRTKWFTQTIQQTFNLLKGNFVIFLNSLLDNDSELFPSLASSSFHKYVKEHGVSHGKSIGLLLIKLSESSFTPVDRAKFALGSQNSYSRQIDSSLRPLLKSDFHQLNGDMEQLSWLLRVARIVGSIDSEFKEQTTRALLDFTSSSKTLKPSAHGAFILGELLSIASTDSDVSEDDLIKVLDNLCLITKDIPSVSYLTGLDNFVAYLERRNIKVTSNQMETLTDSLLPLVRSPSHHFRSLSISIVSTLYNLNKNKIASVSDQFNTCWIIESLPREVASARNLQMHIRNLSMKFTTIGKDEILDKFLPNYLLGLLSDRFQPVWQASLEAIEAIASKSGEYLWTIVGVFLEQQSQVYPLRFSDDRLEFDDNMESFSSCTNIDKLLRSSELLAQQYRVPVTPLLMHLQLEDDYIFEHSSERSLGLKVLLKIPKMAEKNSAHLVPHLLWNIGGEEDEDSGVDAWGWKDRIALLQVFSLFKRPETLIRSDEVYQRYLYLLANRTMDIQKVALKCILTFKNATLKKYSENLTALLDDTQFKDEVVNLLRASGNEGAIHEKDRSSVLPFVVRILFGRAQVARTGGVKQGRRFAVISGIHGLEHEYIRMFVQLAVDRLDCSGFLTDTNETAEFDPSSITLPQDDESIQSLVRRELGFVTMLEELVSVLGVHLKSSLDIIMNALMFCMWHSQQVADSQDLAKSTILAQNIKSIRALGCKCLSGTFEHLPLENWSVYFNVFFAVLVEPKIATFDKDNLQQPSALMSLFLTMSGLSSFAGFLTYENSIIVSKLFNTVSFEGVKDAVIDCVLDVMINILDLEGKSDTQYFDTISDTAVSILLPAMPGLFERSVNHSLLEKESQILVTLLNKGYKLDNDTQTSLVNVSLEALKRPNNQIRVIVKTSILDAFSKLISYDYFDADTAKRAGESLSPLFKQLTDRQARVNLSQVFLSLGEKFDQYKRVGHLLVELNAFSKRRLDTPDFDRRLPAFATINEEAWSDLSEIEWLPLLYSMLFFMKDPEELALRTNATYSVKRFVDCKAKNPHNSSLTDMLDSIVIKEIKYGVREKNELFRVEYVEIIQHVVENDACIDLADMKCLLMSGDDEANFFNNICHIQIHRRRRAVRRLASLADQCLLADTTIAHFLMPLLEHYISGKEGDAHNLADDSIKAISSLSKHLSWNQYRAILKRYVSYLRHKEESMKTTIRLIDTMADSILVPEEDKEEDGMLLERNAVKGAVLLKDTLPKEEKLNNFILEDLSPSLFSNLDKFVDNDDITDRVPVAIPLIKYMKLLPIDVLQTKLPGALSKIAQILRSKAQDVRDVVRKTLGRISKILGTEYLVFMIRELKSALRRGAQLHVLGFTVHSLVSEYEGLDPGDLNDSSKLISEIIMEDIFGVTGAEKDEEGYISKMREVKQQKSYDTGQLLARNVGLSNFYNLIEPVKSMLLYERLTHKTERKVEELLRRYSLGLYHNSQTSTQAVLVMCFELYAMVKKANDDFENQLAQEEQKSNYQNVKEYQAKEREDFFTVKLSSRNWQAQKVRLHPENLHLLTRFILDALRTVLGKNEELMTVEHVTGFLPLISSALTSNFEDVEIAALRTLSLVIKLPFKGIESDLSFFGRRAVDFIKSSPNTNSEICQASLRLLAVLIRQRPDFTLKDSALVYILSRIQPDLEEPDRQGITFTFLKAVLARKIVINEVYDVMDHVAKVMVTNQSHVTRDACRSSYFMFLTDYPQGSPRISKQMTFLVANLEYPAPAGRLSVIEIMHLLVSKVDSQQLKDFLTSIFVGLVLTLVNDDVAQCREHAAAVIREILVRSEQEELRAIEAFCVSWLSEDGPLGQGGFTVAGLFFTELGLKRSPRLYQTSIERIETVLETGRADREDYDSDWKLLYAALQLFEKFTIIDKNGATGKEFQNIWSLVVENLLYPHSWVRLAAARLIGHLYSNCDKDGFAIELTEADLQSNAIKFVRQLGAPEVAEGLATQIVKNLLFISQKWAVSDVKYVKVGPAKIGEIQSDDEEEKSEPANIGRSAIEWLMDRVCAILRSQKRPKEMKVSKKAAAQLLAALCQMLPEQNVEKLAELFIMAFYNYSITEDERDKELHDMAREALNMLQNKIGTTEFVQAYSAVKEKVSTRQNERRAKRAIEAVVAPEAYAKKKLRKNMTKKEKRRQAKDEFGYFHTKKQRTV